MGLFAGFLDDPDVKLVGVEAGGKGLATGEHAASINGGRLGVLHGAKTMLLQTDDGNILDTYSVSAGLDYPGVGPEHCHLHDIGRAEYAVITDDEAIAAFDALCRFEGIIPALESSHALAEAIGAWLRTRPSRERRAFVARYYYAESLGDIARREGMTRSAVKSLLHRVRQGLRQYLEKEGFTL